jgi:hypothetical protein
MNTNDNDRPETPLERAARRAEREAEEFAREQEQYRQGKEDHQEPWRALMWWCRRVDSPYRG